jgi:methylmalonyl-CoA mutase cobalamin-binding subunit
MAHDTDRDDGFNEAGPRSEQSPSIRYLVESALRSVASTSQSDQPGTRDEWVAHLAAAMVSDSETSHRAAISALVASGVSSSEVHQIYIPAVARYLGEMWVNDRASFVDVTVGSARLQALLREAGEPAEIGLIDRSIPLGQSVLMVIPPYEDHALGAFVAADQFRRHGLWVHMGIGLTRDELVDLIASSRFSLVGLTAATWTSVEQAGEFVDYIRAGLNHCPPMVIGGRAVSEPAKVERLTGVDYAVKTVREAVDRAGLMSISQENELDKLNT